MSQNANPTAMLAENRPPMLPHLPLDGCGRQYVMGIVNATPDSFSADGLYQDQIPKNADILEYLHAALDAGADILDIGAESTRPGGLPVSAAQQISRLEPIFHALRLLAELRPQGWCVSLDTSSAEVVAWGLTHGVQIVNDVRAGDDTELLRLVARHRVKIVLMHNSAKSSSIENLRHLGASYGAGTEKDIVAKVCDELTQKVSRAKEYGVDSQQIILDPGIGFGKSVADNIRLIMGTEQLKRLGYPLLVGASRKSFIGKILNLDSAERLEAGLMVHGHALMQGADIIRVHDIAAHHRLRVMVQALQHPETLS